MVSSMSVSDDVLYECSVMVLYAECSMMVSSMSVV